MSVDFETFQKNYENGKTQLVYRWIPSDLETPVSAYLKLANNTPHSFLLESVEGGETLGRFSVIGLSPDMIWTYDQSAVQINRHGQKEHSTLHPLESLRTLLTECHIDVLPDDCPPMASSGLFGMMGYDTVRLIEDIPDSNPDDLNIPDAIFIRPSIMAIFDNVKNELCLAVPIFTHTQNSDQTAHSVYESAHAKIKDVTAKLSGSIPDTKINTTKTSADITVNSNMSQGEFHKKVEDAVEYIHAGEIFQTVISQRFQFDFDLPAFDLYRSLRRLNPSPFLFYFNFENFHLVGSSPEILVRVRDNTLTIRPIAGTRKRGKTTLEDKALAEDLLSDPKERAEHLMLLDLGRNDVGRVAQTGTVKVTDQFRVEYYSHVMHIVSNVEGKLKETCDILDALYAGFPAGTVSGAPKIRAMEIIDELEPVKRKFYAGGVGYLSGNGEMDTCIALRTALVKDRKVYVQAGGGIVADSEPEFEYQESCNKARAIIQAAQNALDLARSLQDLE